VLADEIADLAYERVGQRLSGSTTSTGGSLPAW